MNVKASISRRLREVRQELFGDHGGPELARRLNLPARTWYNYETGVTVPAEVLLAFIDQTGANPTWLLSGEGERYHRGAEAGAVTDLTPIQLIRRGLEKLERQPSIDGFLISEANLSVDSNSEFVAVSLVPLAALGSKVIGADMVEGHVLAYREWLPNPGDTVAVRLDDEAMFPILPAGSVVAVDRTSTDRHRLQGKMVAASPEGSPIVRWLDISGRHMIFRPNQTSRHHPMIPMELDESAASPILGQVVWSWSCFNGSQD